ncbi:MAG: class I SAM-dependent methyltransferase [Deltaproteobacteria bacterium]|nr:class I SAM-dependent methyltransferase [Deltaproteobacteria bacterium]
MSMSDYNPYHMPFPDVTFRQVDRALAETLLRTVAPFLPRQRTDKYPARNAPAAKAGVEKTKPGLFSASQWRKITAQIATLHEAYTGRQSEFARHGNPLHGNMAGYQLYFLPRNYLRARHVLASLPWQIEAGRPAGGGVFNPAGDKNNSVEPFRVLDLGCGTGAFSLAVLALLSVMTHSSSRPVRLTLVDQGHGLLELAVANLRDYASQVLPEVSLDIETHAHGVERFLGDLSDGAGEVASQSRQGLFHIAGGAMMLNELDLLGPRRKSTRGERFGEALRRLVHPGGVAVFVEPGTRRGYMNLMALRPRFSEWPSLYPCPHSDPCPMWEPSVKNWCHEKLMVPGGFFFDQLLKSSGGLELDMKSVHVASQAWQNTPSGKATAPFFNRGGLKAVSDRLPLGGKSGKKDSKTPQATVVLFCNSQGRIAEHPGAGLPAKPRGLWLENLPAPPLSGGENPPVEKAAVKKPSAPPRRRGDKKPGSKKFKPFRQRAK